MSSPTPPVKWDDLPPLNIDFSTPDDPFSNDLFAADDLDYLLDDDPFKPYMTQDAVTDGASDANAPSYDSDAGWGWHDAAIIAVGRVLEDGEAEEYSIGAVDLYANVHTGDMGGSYIEIDTFSDIDQAAAYYHELQGDVQEQGLPPFQLVNYATERAAERAAARGEPAPQWRGATDVEYAVYDEMRSLDTLGSPDLPPDDLELNDIFTGDAPQSDERREASDVGAPSSSAPADEDATFQALHEIGITTDNFDPDTDPPPFVDPFTGTAYWIGVFQPDKDDPENCVTSILSLGRDPETGEMAAQLAPCVPGNWDKTYQAAEYLLGVIETGGIERAFETAEGMALATDQREMWEIERGLPLETDIARELADYTRDEWEIDL